MLREVAIGEQITADLFNALIRTVNGLRVNGSGGIRSAGDAFSGFTIAGVRSDGAVENKERWEKYVRRYGAIPPDEKGAENSELKGKNVFDTREYDKEGSTGVQINDRGLDVDADGTPFDGDGSGWNFNFSDDYVSIVVVTEVGGETDADGKQEVKRVKRRIKFPRMAVIEVSGGTDKQFDDEEEIECDDHPGGGGGVGGTTDGGASSGGGTGGGGVSGQTDGSESANPCPPTDNGGGQNPPPPPDDFPPWWM